MRAAILREYGEPLDLAETPAPEPGPNGAVVEVEACGLCRSDWHAWQGHGEWNDDRVPRGQILGHEPAGEVVAVGETVTRVAEGDRVVVPFSLGDGTCHNCRSGHGNVCTDGLALGFEPDAPGAFAEQVRVPAADHNLVTLPETLDPRDAAVLGCRYVTAYHALADRARIAGGDWLAVHGCGGVGLSAVQLGSALGARVIAVANSRSGQSRSDSPQWASSRPTGSRWSRRSDRAYCRLSQPETVRTPGWGLSVRADTRQYQVSGRLNV